MIINSLKYSLGKNLIKPTYPGRQDTQRIPLNKSLHFTFGINIIDLTLNILMSGMFFRERKLKGNKNNKMRCLQHQEKSVGLS